MANNNSNLIDSLRSQINQLYRRISNTRNAINANNQKIAELIAAKEVVATEKRLAKDRRKTFETQISYLSGEQNWVGDNKNAIQDAYSTHIKQDYNNFVNKLDEYLDVICDEITRLENENMGFFGRISLASRNINSLTNQIRKHMN